jgi:hypothetical protein
MGERDVLRSIDNAVRAITTNAGDRTLPPEGEQGGQADPIAQVSNAYSDLTA